MKYQIKKNSKSRSLSMRRVLYVTCIVLLVLVLGGFTSFAGNNSRVGTAGAQELLIPVGARGIALSGSAIASATGVDAIYWNPAGLARAEFNTDAIFSTMKYIGDVGVNYAAIGVKVGSIGSIGLSLKTLSFGDIPVTTEDFPDGNGQTYSPSFITIGLTYSSLITERVSVGVTCNIISEKIMSTSASGFAANIGIQYSALGLPGLNLGVTIKNVGPNIVFEGADLYRRATLADNPLRPTDYYTIKAAEVELPTYLELGMSYISDLNETNTLTVAGNFQSHNYSNDLFLLGAEFSYKKMFFVRTGYTLAMNETEDAAGVMPNIYKYSLGVGVKLDIKETEIGLDYAYRSVNNFDGPNVLTISVGL
jgi:hypothetical protein